MTIDEQAENSFMRFVEYHKQTPQVYWYNAVNLHNAKEIYIAGWKEGYTSRMEIGFDPKITDDDLWDEGCDRVHKTLRTTEDHFKVFAAGFTGGYKHW